jgi:cation diffusion facilitator CzcD-associated flavoprotein CzcO
MTGLEALAARARAEIALFAYPEKDWIAPRPAPDGSVARDVVIVGGGQSGIGIAAGLMRAHVKNILVLDENPAGLEGPWVTYGRMITLRTLKLLTGPDLGTPSLTFRAWHEAQFGPDAWADLVRIPRQDWMRYLVWLRETLALPVRNDAALADIACEAGLLRLTLAAGEKIWTRKLVLATGLPGAGGLFVPSIIRDNVPRARWAHSAENIDFSALAGKRVAVLGAGASAFDNAATALEAGAARVDLFARRAELPVATALRHVENVGFFRHFCDLSDRERWLFTRRMLATSIPPPEDSVRRATRHANFAMHLGAPWLSLETDRHATRISTAGGHEFEADFLIAATGFSVDLALRPEFSRLLPHIALWSDRFVPPGNEADAALARYPYTGSDYALTARDKNAPAGIGDVHLFNQASLLSNGPTAGGLNGMPFGLPRLLHGLTRDLFRAEAPALYAGLVTYADADPWSASRPPS